MSTTIAIAGFTGRFARLLTQHLLAKPNQNIAITGICRTPSKVPPEIANDSRVKVVKADVKSLSELRQGVRGASVAICCYLGDDELMTDGQKLLIDACIAEKVSRYVASDYSFDYMNGLKLGDMPTKDFTLKVAQYLRWKADEIVAVHPLNGAFTEVFWAPFLGVYDEKDMKLTYWGTGDEPWELTTFSDSAQFVAEIALDQDAKGVLNILGDRLSIKQIASAFQKRYGKDIKLENLGTMDDLKAKIAEVREANPGNDYATMGMLYNYYCQSPGTYLKRPEDVKKYPEVKPMNLEEFLAEHEMEELPKLMEF